MVIKAQLKAFDEEMSNPSIRFSRPKRYSKVASTSSRGSSDIISIGPPSRNEGHGKRVPRAMQQPSRISQSEDKRDSLASKFRSSVSPIPGERRESNASSSSPFTIASRSSHPVVSSFTPVSNQKKSAAGRLSTDPTSYNFPAARS